MVFLGTDDPEAYARALVQDAVRAATGLECSVGIGQNKLQAKVPLRLDGTGKPAGTFRITDATWFHGPGGRSHQTPCGASAPRPPRSSRSWASRTDQVDLLLRTRRRWRGGSAPATGPWLVRPRAAGTAPPAALPSAGRRPPARSRENQDLQQDLDDWDTVRAEVATLARRVVDDVAAEGRPVVRVTVKARLPPVFHQHAWQGAAGADRGPGGHRGGSAGGAGDVRGQERPVRLLGVRAEMTPPPALGRPVRLRRRGAAWPSRTRTSASREVFAAAAGLC